MCVSRKGCAGSRGQGRVGDDGGGVNLNINFKRNILNFWFEGGLHLWQFMMIIEQFNSWAGVCMGSL